MISHRRATISQRKRTMYCILTTAMFLFPFMFLLRVIPRAVCRFCSITAWCASVLGAKFRVSPLHVGPRSDLRRISARVGRRRSRLAAEKHRLSSAKPKGVLVFAQTATRKN